jgi:hypothetical protein
MYRFRLRRQMPEFPDPNLGPPREASAIMREIKSAPCGGPPDSFFIEAARELFRACGESAWDVLLEETLAENDPAVRDSLQFAFFQFWFACDGYSLPFAERCAGVIFDRRYPDDTRNAVFTGISRAKPLLRPDAVYDRLEEICQRVLSSADLPFSDVALNFAGVRTQELQQRRDLLQRWADGNIVVDREKVSDWLRSPEKRYERFRTFGLGLDQLDTLIRYMVLSCERSLIPVGWDWENPNTDLNSFITVFAPRTWPSTLPNESLHLKWQKRGESIELDGMMLGQVDYPLLNFGLVDDSPFAVDK